MLRVLTFIITYDTPNFHNVHCYNDVYTEFTLLFFFINEKANERILALSAEQNNQVASLFLITPEGPTNYTQNVKNAMHRILALVGAR